MVDDGMLGKIFSVAGAAWSFVLLFLVALFKAWPAIMARVNERHRDLENAKDGDWRRLREEIVRLIDRCTALEERCDHLQTEVDDCRRREGEWMNRALAAESIVQGQGAMRQSAAGIVALERLTDKPKDKP